MLSLQIHFDSICKRRLVLMVIYKTGWRKLYRCSTDITLSDIKIDSLSPFIFSNASNGNRVGTCICISINTIHRIIRTFCKRVRITNDTTNNRCMCQPVEDVACFSKGYSCNISTRTDVHTIRKRWSYGDIANGHDELIGKRTRLGCSYIPLDSNRTARCCTTCIDICINLQCLKVLVVIFSNR